VVWRIIVVVLVGSGGKTPARPLIFAEPGPDARAFTPALQTRPAGRSLAPAGPSRP